MIAAWQRLKYETGNARGETLVGVLVNCAATVYNHAMRGRSLFVSAALAVLLTLPVHADMIITHMIQYQGHLVLVGRDDDMRIKFRSLAMIFIAKKSGLVEKVKNFSIIREIDGHPIFEIDDVEETADGLVFWSDVEQYRLTGNKWSRQPLGEPQQQLPYWIDKLALPADLSCDEFPPFLIRRDILTIVGAGVRAVVCGHRRGSLSSQTAGILMVENRNKRFYRLPLPVLSQLKQLRPQLHSQLLAEMPKKPRLSFENYVHQNHRFEIRVGAFARAGDCIWVGTAFSDAGKTLGIGALAGFDMRTRTWRTEYVKELADWSVSALLAEEETLWLGLCRYGPDDVTPGGLARYNTNDGNFDRSVLKTRILRIARFFDRLHLATDDGLYIMTARGMLHLDFSHYGSPVQRNLPTIY